MTVSEIKNTILDLFEKHSDPEIARGAKAYMRNQFEFYGIKSPERRTILKPVFADARNLELDEIVDLTKWCWDHEQRELQYLGMELLYRARKIWDKEVLVLAKELIVSKSWWDTVDYIASNIVGHYFDQFRINENKTIKKWAVDENIWLRRVSIIYQLKRRENINLDLLCFAIEKQEGLKEFFLQKAIGWALRQHAKTNSSWVINFVARNELSPLAKREALKNIK